MSDCLNPPQHQGPQTDRTAHFWILVRDLRMPSSTKGGGEGEGGGGGKKTNHSKTSHVDLASDLY